MSKYIIKREKGKDFDEETNVLDGDAAIECDGFLLITFDTDDEPNTVNWQGISTDMLLKFLRMKDSVAMKIRAAAMVAEAEIKARAISDKAKLLAVEERVRNMLDE